MRFPRSLFIATLPLALLLLTGCNTDVEVGLLLIDQLLPDTREVDREVLIVLPPGAASENALGRMIVQAQREGWRAAGGPGVAEGVADRYRFSRRLTLSLSAATHSGEVMSARKVFPADNAVDSGPFSRLFKPYYAVEHDGQQFSATGHVYANAIWRGIWSETAQYVQQCGGDSNTVTVAFKYPVIWEIICPAHDATATRGIVEPAGSKSLVEARMYGTEFLAEMPLTVRWTEPSRANTFVAALAVILLLTIGIVLLLWFRNSRRPYGPHRYY